MLTVYFAYLHLSKYVKVVVLARVNQPLLLVGMHTLPMAPSSKVIPTVRLFLIGFSAIYDRGDLTYWLIKEEISNLWATSSNAAIAPWEYDFRRRPSVSPCSRFNKASGLPRYSKTMGLGLPLTRLDSTMYQYLWPLDVFDWIVAINSLSLFSVYNFSLMAK